MATTEKKKKDIMHPKVLGTIYIALGILGIAFAAVSIFFDIKDIFPLFGTVLSGAFVGALSILVLIYGYRVFRKDYTPFI